MRNREQYRGTKNICGIRIERLRKMAQAAFPGDHYVPDDGWVICDKEYVGYWSALAYLASVEVSLAKDVAIGVIACYQGASVIESWVPERTFDKIGISLLPEEKFDDHYDETFGMWNGDGFLYNFSLCQVIPYQLSTVIWYQGESDAKLRTADYKEKLKTVINNLRTELCIPEVRL